MGLFKENRLILAFTALNIISGTATGMLQMIVPLYAITLKASTQEIGLIRGSAGLGMLILVLPAGFLIDHYGSRVLYIAGGILSSAVIFTLPLAFVPVLLIMASGIQGLSGSLKFTSLNAAFLKYLNKMGLQKAGWYKGSMSIGLTFIGPLIGGYLVNLMSYRLNFILIGLMTLAPTLAVFFTSERSSSKRRMNLAEIFKSQIEDYKSIVTNRIIKQTVFTESLSTACFASFSTFITVLVVKNFKLPPYVASWMLIAEGAAFIITVFFAGTLLTRFKSSSLYLGSFLLTCMGLLGGSCILSIPLLGASTVIMGVGLGMANLITYSRIGELEGEKGKIAGLFAACTGLGSTFGPMLGGFVGQRFGTQASFLCFVPLFIMLGIYVWRLSEYDMKQGKAVNM